MKIAFKSIIRNFINNPVISLINVLGLSISLVLVITLSTYCYSELTTDTYHKNSDRIYLIGKPGAGMHSPAILKENIDEKVPGVEASLRISGTWSEPVFQVENKQPIVSDLIFTDPIFFDFFSYKINEGNPSEAFKNPLSIVITTKLKKKLFGNEKALGKTIKYNNNQLLTISAVIEEPAENSFLSFSAVTTIDTKQILQPNEGEMTNWGWSNFQTFLLLNRQANDKEIANTIFSLFPKDHQEWIGEINLIPLKEVYFSNLKTFGENYFLQGNRNKALVLLLVASLILIIALVNFINISSSQWTRKINNTGVLKVIGASRFVIFRNLVFESFLLFAISLILALLLFSSITSGIQRFAGISFDAKLILNSTFFLILLLFTITFSILSSIIPGVKISSSKAVDNLKNSIRGNQKKAFLQNGLTTLQLVISIVLISFTILIYKQINFVSNNLVFNQDNSIAIKLTDQLKRDILENELSQNSSIENVSFTQFYPGKQLSSWATKLRINGEEKEVHFQTFNADEGFFKIMRLELLKGQLYSNDLSKDRDKVIVNETFLKRFNIENPIGGTFEMQRGTHYEIIGIIKDFHFKSLEKEIEPLLIINGGNASYCLATINATDFNSLNSTIQTIKNVTAKLSPSFPVEINFLDDAVNKMYEAEIRFRRTFSLFSISAILICAIGILAMSIFASQCRTKEIGIRKVNGARLTEILTMLNSDFIRLVAIAFLVACPISWFAMHKWLENFAYKTEISWWIFVLAGIISFVIALITVSWQSWKAASKNPVEALRYE